MLVADDTLYGTKTLVFNALANLDLCSQQVPWSKEHEKREAISSLSLIFKVYQVYMIKIIVYWLCI